MRVTTRSALYKRFLNTGTNLRLNGEVPLAKDKVCVADVTYLNVKALFIGHNGFIFTAYY
jgi:hypothetical protein